MENMPQFVQTGWEYVLWGWEQALVWLTSAEAWSQFGLLLVAWFAAVYANKKVTPILEGWFTPKASKEQLTYLDEGRLFLRMFLPLLLPLFAYGFTYLGEQIVRSIFDSGAVIAFGKRVFMFIAAQRLVRDILKDPMLRLVGRLVIIPVAALYAIGALELVMTRMEETVVPLGNLSFDLLWLARFVFLAGVIFWLGRWSNDRSAGFIEAQDEMRPATRQLAIKAAEILIFGIAFLVLMNIMGISLTSLAVLGGAVGVGLGFGLQKIASNFISGVILLLEGQATVGDYVELDGGEAGTIVKMTARAAILETFDGRWIVVPNEDFIVTRVVNYSDQGSANRSEAEFSVAYDTDINTIPDIVGRAVEALDFVLTEPERPDIELSSFGDSGVNFVCEFWVNGIDDGKNKYRSKVLFAIWNALKDNNIEIPFPRRVVEMREPVPSQA